MAREKKGKNSFVLYYDLEEQTKMLTDQQVGRLLRMVLAYEIRGERLEEQEPTVQMAFQFLKPGLDINREKYEKMCARNKKNRNHGNELSPVVTTGTDTEIDPDTEPEIDPETEMIMKKKLFSDQLKNWK